VQQCYIPVTREEEFNICSIECLISSVTSNTMLLVSKRTHPKTFSTKTYMHNLQQRNEPKRHRICPYFLGRRNTARKLFTVIIVKQTSRFKTSYKTTMATSLNQNSNKAVEDGRLRPRAVTTPPAACYPIKSFAACCGQVDIVRAGFRHNDHCRLYALLCENMTSSTKPEVHNVLQCRQSQA